MAQKELHCQREMKTEAFLDKSHYVEGQVNHVLFECSDSQVRVSAPKNITGCDENRDKGVKTWGKWKKNTIPYSLLHMASRKIKQYALTTCCLYLCIQH